MSENKDYEDMSLEELKKLQEERQKQDYISNLKEWDNKEEQKQKKLQEEAAKKHDEEVIENFLSAHPEYQKPTDNKLGQEQGERKGKEVSSLEKYYNGYYEREHKFGTGTIKIDKVPQVDLQTRKGDGFVNVGWNAIFKDGYDIFQNAYDDSGCDDDVSSWSPADVYAKMVWNTWICKADLFRVAVKGLAINPGQGLSVQIRKYGSFGDPSELNACECASCASITFSTYSLTLKQYNLEGIVCDKDIWDVGGVLMDSYIDAMSDSWARWFDEQIYSELESASPGHTETLGTAISCTPGFTGSCCSDNSLTNLYHAVMNIIATMREATEPTNPDYMIISPTVASIFKRMQEPSRVLGNNEISFDSQGRLTKLGGLNVIEYCGANSCTDKSAEVVAVVIDSRRAVGAVFGQKPKMYKKFVQECNSYQIDWWSYFAVGELDTNCIAHIVNP